MTMSRIITATTLALSLASASWAVTPTQAGTYVGTLKKTTISASGKTTVKSDMQISVAEDNLTTITVGGTPVMIGTAYYGPNDGFLSFSTGTDINIAEFNFKGTTIKGTAVGVTINPTPSPFLEASTTSKSVSYTHLTLPTIYSV